jgi:hypothetical protein
MTTVLVDCALGTVEVDLDDEEVVAVGDEELAPPPELELDLPLVVAAAAHGSTVIAVVDRRPPLVVSTDGGATWHEAGAGLAPGVAIAISPEHPDLMVYATAERLHVSRDGGRFWTALSVELPSITRVTFAA